MPKKNKRAKAKAKAKAASKPAPPAAPTEETPAARPDELEAPKDDGPPPKRKLGFVWQ